MEIKKTILYKYILLFAIIIFYTPQSIYAQNTINAPLTYTPVLCTGGTSIQYTGAICLNSCYYQNASVEFVYSGFAGGNFSLELSDKLGNFAAPVVLNPSTNIAASPGRIYFNWPQNVAGSGYKLRVKCNALGVTGTQTAAFAAYYKSFNNTFFLNNKQSNVTICGSGSFTLFIDSPTPSEPSPLSFPALQYIWYKNSVVIPGQTGSSINISTAGDYYAAVDYGTCTTSSIAYSPKVTVTIGSGSSFNIVSSGGTTICPSTPTTLSTTPGYSYQWFRDNVSIAGANLYNYVASQPGAYHVVVNQGGCSSSSNTINLNTIDFNASINFFEQPNTNIIAVGDTKNVIVTTDAVNPTFQWYLNGVLLPETTNTLAVTTPGDYKVVVNQTSGCIVSKTIFFKFKEGVNAVKIPNVVSPNGDGINDTWVIPQEYISENTEVLIVSSGGEIALKTNEYQNNWPENALEFKSVNPVYYYIIKKDGKEVKKGSITIIK